MYSLVFIDAVLNSISFAFIQNTDAKLKTPFTRNNKKWR